MSDIKKQLQAINSYIESTARKICTGSSDFPDEIISECKTFLFSEFSEVGFKLGKTKGIYVIKFKEKCDINVRLFNDCEHGAKLRKQKDNFAFDKDCVLYVGKSENLLGRLKQHLSNCPEKTYSLRLYESNRIFIRDKITINCYFINSQLKDFYTIISRKLEKSVAEEFGDKMLTDNK